MCVANQLKRAPERNDDGPSQIDGPSPHEKIDSFIALLTVKIHFKSYY